MSKKEYRYSVKYGVSRRKTETLNMHIGEPHCIGDYDWVVKSTISGGISEEKEVLGRSAFDCLICSMAYLRQTLRCLKSENSKIKFYFELDGELEALTIEDIFMTHDCVTDEMEEMIEWAKDNGFVSGE